MVFLNLHKNNSKPREKILIPLVINKIKDPDNIERFRVAFSFRDILYKPLLSKETVEIQEAYTKLIENCKMQLKVLKYTRKSRGDPILKWNLAKSIYKFIVAIEEKGYYFANSSKAFARDLGISPRQVNYLIEFVQTFPNKKQIYKEISWDKYKEILDVKDKQLQEKIIQKILRGELKTREDIRKFKKSLKIS
jgi:hypothetical protein